MIISTCIFIIPLDPNYVTETSASLNKYTELYAWVVGYTSLGVLYQSIAAVLSILVMSPLMHI